MDREEGGLLPLLRPPHHREARLGAVQHLRVRVRADPASTGAEPHPDRGAGAWGHDLQVYEGEFYVFVSFLGSIGDDAPFQIAVYGGPTGGNFLKEVPPRPPSRTFKKDIDK